MTTTTQRDRSAAHPGDDTTADSMSRPQAARIAGVGYVAIFGLAIFANFFVREGLVVSDDPVTTAANIARSGTLFRAGLASFLAIFLIDIVVAWALYVFFRPERRDLSLVAAWCRLVYTVFLGVAAIFFFQALALYESPAMVDSVEASVRNAQALVALETFNSAWLIGLAAFGLHLVVIGFLMVGSARAPRWLGYLLGIAGVAYVVDTMANALLANYADYAGAFLAMVAVPSIIGEGWFGLWLLTRAGRDPK